MFRKTRMQAVISLSILSIFLVSSEVRHSYAASGTNPVKKYAFVPKSTGNPYFRSMEEGFIQVIEEAGAEAVICEPANPYADDQIPIIDSLIVQGVNTITVAANSKSQLNDILERAEKAGISIITVDSDTDPRVRAVFCNRADEAHIAKTLMDAVLDISEGEGEFAVLSTTPDASNQNAWIREMQSLLENDPDFQNLRLVQIAYGEDRPDISEEKTIKLLTEYPDLKVICAPTAAGIPGVAKALSEAGSSVRVTGLGMPSQMAFYIKETPCCPYIFLWNPENLGKLTACTCLALEEGAITGSEGEQLDADPLQQKTYTIESLPGKEEGTEIILNELICFSPDNIDEWGRIF